MDTISAIKGVIMGIAAQGAVTVTIPNDHELTRELGPIEMTRQLGPIELRIKSGPAKNVSVETNVEKAPVESAPVQDAPARSNTQTAPAKVENKPARARVASNTPAATTANDAVAQEAGYEGLWYDHTGRSAIKITKDGAGLSGRIAWLKDSAHNSVCGTDIIGGVKKIGNVYDKGWIYDIENDKKFDVELKLLNQKQMQVKGYLGTKLFSKTFVWKRAPGNLELCS